MADAVGLTASIVALAEMALRVVDYLHSVKQGGFARKKLADETLVLWMGTSTLRMMERLQRPSTTANLARVAVKPPAQPRDLLGDVGKTVSLAENNHDSIPGVHGPATVLPSTGHAFRE